MIKIINYQCHECGAIKEGFEGGLVSCDNCTYISDFLGIGKLAFKMRPIFSPKRNSQRWILNDKRKD